MDIKLNFSHLQLKVKNAQKNIDMQYWKSRYLNKIMFNKILQKNNKKKIVK